MLNLLHRSAPLAVPLGILLPSSALAYIGPGAGLGAIAVTVALALGVLLLLVGLVWFPLKRLLKGSKGAAASDDGKDVSE